MGVLGKCHASGNDGIFGKHSCGYYDVALYKKSKREHLGNENFLKLVHAHVGVVKTRHKTYIEDRYVK